MIQEIFDMVIKEARSRPGEDLERKIYRVIAEVHVRLMVDMQNLTHQEKEGKQHET